MALRTLNSDNWLVREVLQRITALTESGKQIVMCWIPSHVGIAGNEEVDAAARRAARRPCTRRFPLPARDFYPTVSAFMTNTWQRAWTGCQRNKLLALKPRLAAWPSSSRKSRREEVTLCRLRTGHTHGTHGYLLCGGDSPVCPRCDAELTVRHVLLDCPQLEGERARHLGRSSRDLTLHSLLGDDSAVLESGSLFAFISAAQLSVIYSPR